MRFVLMANGQQEPHAVYTVAIDWDGETRLAEVLALDGNSLLGMVLLDGNHVHIGATHGGEIVVEPL